MRCGSDTLVTHPTVSGFHRRKHICAHCRKLFWLEYHHQELEFSEHAGILILPGIAIFLAAYLYFKIGVLAAISLTAMVLLFAWPIYASWIKYESAQIKGECKYGEEKSYART